MKRKHFLKSTVAILLSTLLYMVTLSTFTLPAAAASASEWNGKTTLKSGENYVVSKDTMIDASKLIIPVSCKLTITGTVKVTSDAYDASVKGTLNIDGTGKLILSTNLIVNELGSLRNNGTLYINPGYTVDTIGMFNNGSGASFKLLARDKSTDPLEISVGKLTKAFDKDFDAASAKYSGKEVTFTDTIAESGKSSVRLKSKDLTDNTLLVEIATGTWYHNTAKQVTITGTVAVIKNNFYITNAKATIID